MWIPTKQKLPPFDTPVLVYCKIYGKYIGLYQRIIPSSNYGLWSDGEKSGLLPPTHWMPLPGPPKNSKEVK